MHYVGNIWAVPKWRRANWRFEYGENGQDFLLLLV